MRTDKIAFILLATMLTLAVAGCASAPAFANAVKATPASTQQAASSFGASPSAATAPTAATSSAVAANPDGLYRTPEEAQKPLTEFEAKLIAFAKTLIGQKPNAVITVNGKKFKLDCIGTVSAIFYGVGIDIQKDFYKYSLNGVGCLYMTLKDHGLLHRDKNPRPGDVIFWDNTWDANGNGDRTDDLRTHAGIVISVDEAGTISYLHESIYAGVTVEYMNLYRPDVQRDENKKTINTGIAIATKSGGPLPEHWLAGDVFGSFGDVLKEKQYFEVDTKTQGQ